MNRVVKDAFSTLISLIWPWLVLEPSEIVSQSTAVMDGKHVVPPFAWWNSLVSYVPGTCLHIDPLFHTDFLIPQTPSSINFKMGSLSLREILLC
jgi:hypothetical protein